MMLQRDDPEDYVIATGESRSVRDFIDEAAKILGMGLRWKSSGATWGDAEIIGHDTAYLRPLEVDHLRGDASKAKRELGWSPKTSFEELVREMVEAELGTPTGT